MRNVLPARLRGPALVAAASVVVVIVGGATHGWGSVAYVVPIPVLLIVAVVIAARRDSDLGAAVRHETDERQAAFRRQVQALVGQVLALAVVVGYIVAAATKSTLWPWEVMLGLIALSVLAGWLLYGDRTPRGDDAEDDTPARRPR